MLKHSNIARRRSLNLPCDGDIRLSNLDNSTSRSDSPRGTFKRKYARSVRIKSSRSPAVETSSVILRRNRNHHLSIRAKSSFLQPSDDPFDLPALKNPSKQDKFGSVKMKKFVQVKQKMPVCDWTTDDACDWLKLNNLDSTNMLSTQFQSYAINGRHLADPESAWEHMNKLSFLSDRHKQEVLLKLADCLRESPSKLDSPKSIGSVKSPARVRFRPPSAVSYSTDSMMSSSDYVSGSSSSSTATGPSSASEQDMNSVDVSVTSNSSTSAKKMMRAISSLKNAVSKPKNSTKSSDNTSPKKLHSIWVYSDLQSTGKFSQTELHVTETTTTKELLQMFMDFSSLSEDINLFQLSDVTIPTPDSKSHKGRGSLTSRRPLEPEECPLAVYKSFSSSSKKHTTRRIELTQSKGVVIKLICRIGNHKLRGKQFRVSMQSTVDHVIRLALRKFRLRNVDPNLFALCEISMSGDIVEINSSCAIQWQNGTSLILCDRPSLKKVKSDASGRLGKFKRSGSLTSNLSFESRDSSGSESWAPYYLDRSGRLTEKVLIDDVTCGDASNVNDDVTIEDISITNDIISSKTSSPAFRGNSEPLNQNDANTLSLDNSILQAELYEKSEQMDSVFRKVSRVRQVLEGGLQKYHEESFYQMETNTGTSLTIENELKSTEQLINDTEELLGQLFRHQRQVSAKHNRSQSAPTGVNFSSISSVEDAGGVGNMADIELQIAFHQADLLALKHKHQVLDMKMSLFVANKKAEKFRHMISGSLYDIAGQQHAKTGFNNNNSDPVLVNNIHVCEVFSGNSGYGLALRDDKDSRQGGARGRGAVMDCPHQQGGLKEGDRLLEVNGINVQNVGADSIAKILKETSSARIVVLRKEKRVDDESTCDVSEISIRKKSRDEMGNDIVPSPTSDVEDIMIKNFTCDKLIPGSEEMADWREMGALKSDLSMLMSELEVTSRGKRELERDLAKRKHRDVALERENARLKEQIKELSKNCRPRDSCDSG